MLLLEAIYIALAQIRAQKLKSFFTLLGVTIGVMFLIAVVSIVQGMKNYVEHDFLGRFMGANTFTLERFPNFANNTTREEWREWIRRPRIYPADVAAVRAALQPGLHSAVESASTVVATTQYSRPKQVDAHAVDEDYFTIKNYNLSSGRMFSPQEMALGSTAVVIGYDVATQMFPSLDPIGRELRMGGIPYVVIGVIEKQGSLFGQSLDRIAIAPFRSPLRHLTNPRGDIDGLLVQAPDPVTLNLAMETVRESLRGARHLRPAEKDNFVMETSAAALSFFDRVMNIMAIAGTALPAIGLVVGGMVIMNIMLVSVAERTHEIGIRKSIGARRRDILNQFLVESATLSTLGAAIGIVLGLLAAKTISWKWPFLPAAVAPWSIVAATILGTVVGIVSGVYPARRASRLDPIEAMRQE